MSKRLKISETLSLPIDVATRAIALVGNRGSGKTSTSTVLTEEMFDANVPVVVLDPVGARWGVRSSKDGKSAGLPFVLFGGEHSPDAPLYEESGETLADAVLEYGMSAVLDMSLLRKNAMRRFATEFLERLYQKSRSSMHLVLEEAPVFAPQRVEHGAERLLGACEDVVLRGRGRGIGVTLVAQRAQSINKSVLSQCEVLVALRQAHNLDKKAIRDWIDEQAGGEHVEVIGELAGLQDGECFVWSPVNKLLERTKIRLRRTFDSGATPKPGERLVEPKQRAEIDMEALKGRLASTLAKAKAEDPKALQARVRELERELAKKVNAASAAPPPKPIEIPVVDSQTLKEFELAADKMHKAFEEIRIGLRKHVHRSPPEPVPLPPMEPTNGHRATVQISRNGSSVSWDKVEREHRTNGLGQTAGGLGGGERKMLTAIAQHGDDGCDREQLTVLTGYKRSSRDTYLQRLRSAGLIEENMGGNICATEAGLKELGSSFEPLPRGSALRDHWLARLPEGERRILDLLIEHYPNGTSRERIDAGTGYRRSSRDTYLQRLRSRKLVVTHGSEVKASHILFDGDRS